MPDLITLITATDPGLRNQPLEAACAELSLPGLLEQCTKLDAFRRHSENLYKSVCARCCSFMPFTAFTCRISWMLRAKMAVFRQAPPVTRLAR